MREGCWGTEDSTQQEVSTTQGLKWLKKERIVSEPKKKRKDGNEVVGQVIRSWGTPSSQIYK